jgi:hypothetical protein
VCEPIERQVILEPPKISVFPLLELIADPRAMDDPQLDQELRKRERAG